MTHRLEDVIALFDGLFQSSYGTCLIRGDEEPLYLPTDHTTPFHRIIFAHSFYASALHEISHWCIAGARRRQWEDYGYWYLPDGRDAAEQQDFEGVEVAPQALELLFSQACGLPFNVSVDNLGGEAEIDRDAFQTRVEARAACYLYDGLPVRAAALERALQAFYHHGADLEQALAAGRVILKPASMPS